MSRFAALCSILYSTGCLMTLPAAADEASLKKAVTFYASFDDKVQADVGVGAMTPSTRSGSPGKGPYKFTDGFDAKAYRIAAGKGISGGALEATDVLPDNGRMFFPAKGNIAFKKGGWSGAVSCWINTDPNTSLKTSFCDPYQITQKGANNGGIWFDFNNAKPKRDMRMGLFSAVPEGAKGVTEDDPKAPMVKLPGVDFKVGDWHHIVVSFDNLDTGKPNGQAALYVDGKKIGGLADQAIAMDWDIEKAGIYVAVNYIGLLDEFAVFNRALGVEDVNLLHKQPGVLASLKRK